MTQLAQERQSTVFIGTHVDYDTRDQLRALARRGGSIHQRDPSPRSTP